MLNLEIIKNKIYTIREQQVMFDGDLAQLYNVETKILNQAVKRNIERFPVEFMFQLTEEELNNLRSQIVTSSLKHGGRRYLPYVFTEQGVAMLSAVLRSKIAIKVSIQIINAFVEMRKIIANTNLFDQRLNKIERKQIETDKKFEIVFNAIENKSLKPKQGIFFDGQVFDAYVFVSDLIKSATKSIILIDNYIDETVLQLFTKRKKNIAVTIYTKNISKILKQDLKKYNTQYASIKIKKFIQAHDRFLIIDENILYHFGASLKDLGNKWFAFSILNKQTLNILNNLN